MKELDTEAALNSLFRGMKYKIGDVVYKSGTTYSTETIQCPDCLGTKEWIITFADGEAMIIGCQTCTKRIFTCIWIYII